MWLQWLYSMARRITKQMLFYFTRSVLTCNGRVFHSCSLLKFPVFPAVPTVPPGNVQAEAVNSSTVRFTWNAPSPQFINGINQGYKVCISLLPSSGQS